MAFKNKPRPPPPPKKGRTNDTTTTITRRLIIFGKVGASNFERKSNTGGRETLSLSLPKTRTHTHTARGESATTQVFFCRFGHFECDVVKGILQSCPESILRLASNFCRQGGQGTRRTRPRELQMTRGDRSYGLNLCNTKRWPFLLLS
jgi:hypothetical protein